MHEAYTRRKGERFITTLHHFSIDASRHGRLRYVNALLLNSQSSNQKSAGEACMLAFATPLLMTNNLGTAAYHMEFSHDLTHVYRLPSFLL